MICAAPDNAMPRTRARVVCTLRETNRDLGADGLVDEGGFAGVRHADEGDEAAPCLGDRFAHVGSPLEMRSRPEDTFALEKDGRGRLFGDPLGRPHPLGVRMRVDRDGDEEYGRMIRPVTTDEPIDRHGEALGLCPFLQGSSWGGRARGGPGMRHLRRRTRARRAPLPAPVHRRDRRPL